MSRNRRWIALAAAAFLCAPAQSAAAAAQVTGLEVDATAEPLGIDDATPRFSWRLETDERGAAQTSYRVVVASTAARAAAGQGDVWDSGEVASAEPFADYTGPALASRTRYHWSVRVAPAAGWAAPSWFETAYLQPGDWKGDWISGPQRIERRLTYAEGAADDACCLRAATTLSAPAAAGATNVKVDAVNAFTSGATVTLENESATIASVGTPTTRTTLGAAAAVGATSIRVANITWLRVGDTITLDAGENAEDATITGITPSNFGASTVTIAAPLTKAHANGAAVFGTGSGITFSAPLTAAHPEGAALTGNNVASEFCRPPGTGFGPMFEGACREIRPEPLLRKTFTLDGGHGAVVEARLYSAGLAYNNITLNGTRTSDRVLAPGFTRYSRTVEYTTDDVTSLVRPGENVLATRLGSGQYDNETTSNDWHWEDAEWRGTPRLRADLYVTYADGTEQLVRSDGSWKVNLGPTRFDAYYLGETFDARKDIAGWEAPGFDASAWPAVRTVEAPAGTLRAMAEEATKVVADWPAGARTSPRAGVDVYDTGQQRAGWATIKVHGAPAGTPIQVLYAEKLNPDGTVTNSGFTAVGQIQTDYYIAKGTGTPENPEVFTPQYTYKGFQYIQVSSPSNPASTQAGSGTPQPLPSGVSVTVDSVQEVRQALRPTGAFATTASLLERIHHNMLASLHENYVASIITDTPVYEKNAWTGDASLTAPTASLMLDTERQFWKVFQDLVENQEPTGELTLLAPTNNGYGHVGQTFKNATNAGATPVWDSYWFTIPWESYLRYGDKRGLAKTYPAMKLYLDEWIPRWTDKDGDAFAHTLTSGLGDWDPPTGIDAPEGAPTRVAIPTIIAPVSTAYVAYEAKIAADTARALGHSADAAHFDELFEQTKADFNAKWWDASVGHYRENPTQILAQTFQSVALAFGLVPDEHRRSLQEKLIEDIMVTRNGHEMVGIVGSRWIFPVLTQAAREGVPGAAQAAYTIARQTTYPSYGYWDALGWTSLGEYWERSSRTRTHHMFGSIGQWFYEGLAGIEPLAPGYAEVSIRPLIASGIDHAEASYDSVRGTIRSSWAQVTGGLELDVTIPPNATGRVHVPGTDPSKVGEVGSGIALIAGRAPGVTLVGVEGDSVVYRVTAGNYRFRVGPGVFAATEATGTVGGTVPPTLSLALGTPASFGAFTPGIDRVYEAGTSATVTSTAGNATLSVTDPSSVATGRLVNGAFSLAEPLQVRARANAFAPLSATAGSPLTLLTYSGPVSNDTVALGFRQHMTANEALRTGAYGKTLTFTLSTTAP